MVTKTKQNTQILRIRELAAKRLDDWRERNAEHLQKWDGVNILRSWREQRWSSSTHQ